jgi:putative FmdB family regulatory protein
MPTYDYACTKCGHQFEAFQSMSDKLLTKCPKCKTGRIKRLIGSGAGIVFKGTGFYETDYKRKQPAAPGATAAPASDAATKSCANCPKAKGASAN